jgi:uncharacterized protein YkwD
VPATRTPAAALPVALLTAILLAASLLSAPSASAATTREGRLLAKINATRTSHGLAPLHEKPYLTRYARHHARQMAARGGLFHTADFGVLCCWSVIGENVGYNSTVPRMHRAFLASPPHRANILNPAVRQAGIGIVKVNGELWVTEIFRRHS